MIRAVCFDLDGVYFTSVGFKLFKEAVVNLGAEREKVEFYFHKEPMEEFKRGEIEESDFWEEAVKYLNLSCTPSDLMNLLVKEYKVNTEVKNFVLLLKQNHYKTCICSNNFVTRVQKLESKFNFLQNFDIAVFSYQVGVLKPNKEIFKHLLGKLHVQANELFYSDDNADKLLGAKELGINTYIYKDFEDFKVTLNNLGVIIK